MATLNMDIIQININTSFLNATLDKPVYMTQPEGFIEPGKEDHVCRFILKHSTEQSRRPIFGVKDTKKPSENLVSSPS
jgi:hypothetical protein